MTKLVMLSGPVIPLLASNFVRFTSRSISSGAISVLGIGTPLLDITLLEDQGLTKRFGLSQKPFTEVGPAHRQLFHDALESPHKPLLTLGGTTQSTIRIAQWMLGQDGRTVFYGSIGDDKLGALMQQLANDSPVQSIYRVRRGVRTGAVLSLNLPKGDYLVRDFGTAGTFNTDVNKDEEMQPIVQDAKLIYMGAYLWSNSPVTGMSIARFAGQHGTPLAMDLQSTLFCPFFASRHYDVLKYIDFLFGNAEEALALAVWLARSDYPFAEKFATFAKEKSANTELLMEIARQVAHIPKEGLLKHRCVVFTHGPNPAVFCDSARPDLEGTVPVCPTEPGSIKDFRGRGDAFIGGFLARTSQGADVKTACSTGIEASQTVLQAHGCNV